MKNRIQEKMGLNHKATDIIQFLKNKGIYKSGQTLLNWRHNRTQPPYNVLLVLSEYFECEVGDLIC